MECKEIIGIITVVLGAVFAGAWKFKNKKTTIYGLAGKDLNRFLDTIDRTIDKDRAEKIKSKETIISTFISEVKNGKQQSKTN